MKRLRWQILVVLATLAVVAILLLSQQPALQSFLPQPASGGIYTEALIGAFSRLNPLLDLNNQPDHDVDRLIFSGLVRFDARGLAQADLAESWGVSQDGMIYNFTLRPNAVWHDGQPVTSDDVIFTIELMRSSASFYPQDVKDLWGAVEVTRLDDKNLKFTLPEPFAPFLDYLTFGVLPRHLLADVPPDALLDAGFNLAPIGSGPYRFERFLVEDNRVSGVVLTAFDRYYGQAPFLQQIVFRYYDTSTAALEAYRRGEVLGIGQITPEILMPALAEPNLAIYTGRLPQLSLVLFNLKNNEVAFLQDAEVRHALLLGLNRVYMINTLLNGQAIPADGPILPGSWAYYDGVPHLEYDPEQAIARLKKLGYVIPAGGGNVRSKDGQALSFTLLHPDDALHTAVAQEIQREWADIGVQVALEAVPYDRLLYEYLDPRDYQAALVDLTLARTPDPDPYPFWHQAEATGGQNYAQWDNRAASEYLEQARITPDIAVRSRLYRNFQVVFARELPALPLYYPVFSFGVDASVQGVQIAPLYDLSDRLNTIADWYLVTRRALTTGATPTP